MRKTKAPLKKTKVARRGSGKLAARTGTKALLISRSRGQRKKAAKPAVRKPWRTSPLPVDDASAWAYTTDFRGCPYPLDAGALR